MGTNTSKTELDEIKSRYEVVGRDESNNLTYLTDKRNGRGYMLKELFANDEASIRNIESELVRKKHLRHEHLAELKGRQWLTKNTTSTWVNNFAAECTLQGHSTNCP